MCRVMIIMCGSKWQRMFFRFTVSIISTFLQDISDTGPRFDCRLLEKWPERIRRVFSCHPALSLWPNSLTLLSNIETSFFCGNNVKTVTVWIHYGNLACILSAFNACQSPLIMWECLLFLQGMAFYLVIYLAVKNGHGFCWNLTKTCKCHQCSTAHIIIMFKASALEILCDAFWSLKVGVNLVLWARMKRNFLIPP